MQLALLTAAVKLFIYKPHSDTTKALVHKVLKWATEEVDNPDLRDRGFMYWRMLAINPTVAGQVVLAEKPPITTDADRMDRGALDQLLLHTGTLGSIYHKNPEVCRSCKHAAKKLLTGVVSQTFIRNATGRALTDSPALNPLSRQVLVPIARTNLPPTSIHVPGPGPPEPSKDAPATADLLQAEVPAAPSNGAVGTNGANGSNTNLMATSSSQESPEDVGDDDEAPAQARPSDPYAGLDNAFGGYIGDEPRPQGNDLLDML